MEFGIKRVVATVEVVATMRRMYSGSPISLAALGKESKLSVSYLEQIFSKLRQSKIVTSQRGPGGGYHLQAESVSVADIIRAVTNIPDGCIFTPVLEALEQVQVSQLTDTKTRAS